MRRRRWVASKLIGGDVEPRTSSTGRRPSALGGALYGCSIARLGTNLRLELTDVEDSISMLCPGQNLLNFRLVEQIGIGGMGVVWKAVDTTLDREVAIKVLHEAWADNEERLSRLKSEAKHLASLNHPRVATVYGFFEVDGIRFLALELLTGETLQRRIARGRVPVEDALALALQIAEALEAAHGGDVIHRDLKPGNIMVDPDEAIKVLDFGLATSPPAPQISDSQSPTVTARTTRENSLLGTAPYMSPEQARGQAVDKRTDIWAFGCVLYEMLTGRPAFPGETVPDVLGRVLHGEPDWARLPTRTPRRIRDLLRQTLCRDARDRLHDAADARIQVADALARPEVDAIAEQPKRGRVLAWMAALFVGLLVGAMAAWSLLPREVPPAPRIELSVVPPSGVELAQRWGSTFAVSNDGQTLVYSGRKDGTDHLYRRRLSDFDSEMIEGTSSARYPAISPDGDWVAFVAGGALKMVPTGGGPITKLYDFPDWAARPVWLPDGSIVISTLAGLRKIAVPGGAIEELTSTAVGDPTRYSAVDLLPGGEAVLFTAVQDGVPSVAVQRLDSNEPKILTEGEMVGWHATDHVLFSLAGGAWAVPFDIDRLELSGTPIELLEDASYITPSAGDTIFYLPGVRSQALQVVDQNGTLVLTLDDEGLFAHPRISPDGRRVVVEEATDATHPQALFVYDLERGTKTRLKADGRPKYPLWIPNSEEIAYSAQSPSGHIDVWRCSADGSGGVDSLLSSDLHEFPESITSSGETLVFSATPRPGSQAADLRLMQLDGDGQTKGILETRFDEREAALSPDDRWIAYVSDESGQDEVYVRQLQGSGHRVTVSSGGGTGPVWTRDGKCLIYLAGETLMAVDVDANSGFRVGQPRSLFDGPFQHARGRNFDVSPDGERFVMVTQHEEQQRELRVVHGWQAALSRPPGPDGHRLPPPPLRHGDGQHPPPGSPPPPPSGGTD